MPKFTLRMWAEQTLFDCNDYDVEAETLEEAVEQLRDLQEAAQGSDDWQESPDNIMPLGGDCIAVLDPEEIVDGADGITLIDEKGKRLRDLDGVPTGCIRLGEPLDGPDALPPGLAELEKLREENAMLKRAIQIWPQVWDGIGKLLRTIAGTDTGPLADEADQAADLRQIRADRLADLHGGTWGEHPDYTAEKWRLEVEGHDTRLGYWPWVLSQIEAAAALEAKE